MTRLTHGMVAAPQLPFTAYDFDIRKDQYGDATGYQIRPATVLRYGTLIHERVPTISVKRANGQVLRAAVEVLYPTYHDAEADALDAMLDCLTVSSYHKLERQRDELVKLLAATTVLLARVANADPALATVTDSRSGVSL